MTLRQVHYRLAATQVIENTLNQYKCLSTTLVKARQSGLIPWEWIEDRIRQPRIVSMWKGLNQFVDDVRDAYKKDVWETQPRYVEVWLEKDALSGIFEPITSEYGVTLVVGRGYNSWSALKDAADCFEGYGKPGSILYFGDFDSSGEDIPRALEESLNDLGMYLHVEKVALNPEDIKAYNLPPQLAKKTDSRSKAFVEKHGDIAVELDALLPSILRTKLRQSIETNLDLSALETVRKKEADERSELLALLDSV